MSGICPGLGHLYAGRPSGAVIIALAPSVLSSGLTAIGAFNPGALVPLALAAVGVITLIWVGQVVWAIVAARRAASTYRLAWYNRALVYVGFFLLSTLAGRALNQPVRWWIVEPMQVPTAAMAPALLPGDQVFVVKVGDASRWETGDIISYRSSRPVRARSRTSNESSPWEATRLRCRARA